MMFQFPEETGTTFMRFQTLSQVPLQRSGEEVDEYTLGYLTLTPFCLAGMTLLPPQAEK